MAVNTNVLKIFAPAMRRQLISGVGRKLDLLINTRTPDTLTTYAKQIENLREEQDQNREQLIEKIAYTWFNRLCALRYLDAKNWHPFACKVLMPAKQDETQPELLKLMRSGSLPNELKRFTNEQRLNNLLDNQIPTALQGGDPQAEVYRELVLASCRSYNHLLPDLFEALDDATELLLPDDLLTENSIAGSFRKEISDSDCEDVEIIGWLYQFYISEKKDEVIGKVVKSEDIPAATQLFTPNWIVKYMVQNTIGAKWLATYPNSSLREQMEFYVEPAEQIDEVKSKLNEITPTSLNPEEITLLDPACGSGHILVEAYNIFQAIYLEQGYQQNDIPKLILEKNIFGLDIDERSAQLTSFALLMKGRSDSRNLFERSVKLNVIALRNSSNLDMELLENHLDLSDYGVELSDLLDLKKNFDKATTFGSLIKLKKNLSKKLSNLRLLSKSSHNNLFIKNTLNQLGFLIRQSELLTFQYDTVIANPPYMGNRYQEPSLKEYLKENYLGYERDIFSAFIDRNLAFSKQNGRIGLMTPNVWMYISSYESMRNFITSKKTLSSLVELPLTGFKGATVQICSYIYRNIHIPDIRSSFIRLVEFKGGDLEMSRLTKKAIQNRNCSWYFETSLNDLKKIPKSPLAYWISQPTRNVFTRFKQIYDCSISEGQNITANNDTYLRLHWEVSAHKIEPAGKWSFYAKGGPFRKWYGNLEYVVDWSDSARNHYRSDQSARIIPEYLRFREGITWTLVTSSSQSFRYLPSLATFDKGGSSIFFENKDDLRTCLSFLNTKVASHLTKSFNPTLNLQVDDVRKLPIALSEVSPIPNHYATMLLLARIDWDYYERSWDFKMFPLLEELMKRTTLESSYNSWIIKTRRDVVHMKELEEENNRLFLNVYGLKNEITDEVPTKEITLTINPSYRYKGILADEERWDRFKRDTMTEFLSYSVGCMMGRYSLYHLGLILGDSRESQEAHLTSYETKVGKQISDTKFKIDKDGIIPILDGEWFEDDIVARTREFIAVTFPESSVAENLRFIENSIGKDIRKYFCKDFYKDHLQTYKKRPIYWMVQSPNAGFACLIYLHRYTPETLLQVLNDYFRPYLQKLEARLTLLDLDQVNDALSKREQIAARKEAEKINKVIKECQDWEKEILLPLAQKRIKLDLDDGVKVNYLKLQDVLANIPGLKAKGKK